MFASIFILILFLPIAFLPLALTTRFSSKDLNEMGISLEKPEAAFLTETAIPVQGYQLVDILPSSKSCEEVSCHWKINDGLQIRN